MTTEHVSSPHRCFCCGAVTELPTDDAVRHGWSFQPVRAVAACPRHGIHIHDLNAVRTAHQHGMTAEEFYQRAIPCRGETSHPADSCVLAVTHYGDTLRDTTIGLATFRTHRQALEALREVFAEELGAEADALAEADLLSRLRWRHNVIAEIAPVPIPDAP